MRHTSIYVVAGLMTLLFAACQKESLRQQPGTDPSRAGNAAGQKSAVAQSKNLVLETFTHTDLTNGTRQYQFVYSPNGQVDSIVVSGNQVYVYRVFYKGAHIDSVNLVQNDTIVSTITNFRYQGNLIVGFDYFDRLQNAPFPTSYSTTYDQQKRIWTIERSYQNATEDRQEFIYNAGDDVIGWSETGSQFFKSATYTYDEKFNPLHFVPDLFAIMVEEQWIWEYIFSLHNSTTKAYLSGQTVTYQNQYSSSGQLVSKTFTGINSNEVNTFTFTYQ